MGRATPQQKSDFLARAPELERTQVFERAMVAVTERTSMNSLEKSSDLERANLEKRSRN
jgi:hypothetical protein